MEQYSVPQFIEQEAKIVVFLSFRQFLYLIVAGTVCFILYYVLPFPLFLAAAFVIAGGTLALSFLRVGGIPLTTIVWNSFGFLTGTRHYTWKKKEVLYPFKVIKKVEIKKIEEGGAGLKVGKPSRLKKIGIQAELKTK